MSWDVAQHPWISRTLRSIWTFWNRVDSWPSASLCFRIHTSWFVWLQLVSHRYVSHVHPRLTVYSILNQDEHALTLWAPDCSSWGLPARSTSQRSFVSPMGGTYAFVQRANCMVSRNLESIESTCKDNQFLNHLDLIVFIPFQVLPELRMVLCILLIMSRNAFWLVEQPAQSLLYMHKRWQYLANRIAWVPWINYWFLLRQLT